MAQSSKSHTLPKVHTSGSLADSDQPGGHSAFGGTDSWRSGPSLSPSNVEPVAPDIPLPPPRGLTPRPLNERENQLVLYLGRLQFFLATAPTQWAQDNNLSITNSTMQPGSVSSPDPNLNKFHLPNGEHVSCVYWNKLFHITGTDIVRALVFRFEAFSRPVKNVKKFEEGVFSDLRNLKPGTDACLEEPKSAFLDLLFRNGCIRTQKKQKVFYWFSVPHDRLFLDALERDLKREKMGLDPTTAIEGEPARSFRYDPTRGLFEQFAGDKETLGNCFDNTPSAASGQASLPSNSHGLSYGIDALQPRAHSTSHDEDNRAYGSPFANHEIVESSPQSDDDGQAQSQPDTANSVLFSKTLFVGSPAYKQRRKRSRKRSRRAGTATTGYDTEESSSEPDAAQKPLPMAAFTDWSTQPVGGFTRSTNEYDNYLGAQRLDQTAAMSHQQLGSGNTVANAVPLMFSSVSRDRDSLRLASDELVQDSSASIGQLHPSQETITPSSISNTPGTGFTCPLIPCGRPFKRLEHLKRHVRTHTQERPFGCLRCPKRFSRSDNLTQHNKTHEKADRGERMKTELSETAGDDINFLEAEVDAMSSRGHRMWAGPALASRLRHSTHDGIAAAHGLQPSRYHPYGVRLDDHLTNLPPQITLAESMWTTPLPAYTGATHLAPNATRRHRSMTPHPPSNPTFMTENWLGDVGRGSRHFPQAINMFGGSYTDETYHRATSLDPSTLNARSTPLHLQVPNTFNAPIGGTVNAVNDNQMGSFASHDHSGLSEIPQVDSTKFGEHKTNLADEYTNWEQHNA